jgi:A/G-specific adenine glycosylase
MINQALIPTIRRHLLDWYDQTERHMPWRARGNTRPNPYYVWLSEIMLQQTTVATVTPYFEKFIRRWPTLADFAGASLEELRTAWQGLGYYSRARNMHRCAEVLQMNYGGNFPQTAEALLELPGVGPYTAAALASIAFDQAVVPVDGNVLRVMARLGKIKEPLPDAKGTLGQLAEQFAHSDRPGDFAQALMDLGATVCTPRKPKCGICPVQNECLAFKSGHPERLPLKAPKKLRPKQYTTAYIHINAQQHIALRRRPEKGLLAGLLEVPCSPWQSEPLDAVLVPAAMVRHVFTHIDLTIRVIRMSEEEKVPLECFWVPLKELDQYPLPTLTHKIIAAGLSLIARSL